MSKIGHPSEVLLLIAWIRCSLIFLRNVFNTEMHSCAIVSNTTVMWEEKSVSHGQLLNRQGKIVFNTCTQPRSRMCWGALMCQPLLPQTVLTVTWAEEECHAGRGLLPMFVELAEEAEGSQQPSFGDWEWSTWHPRTIGLEKEALCDCMLLI